MVKTVSFVHPQQMFEFLLNLLVRKCDLCSDDPTFTVSPKASTSQASLRDFRIFVSIIEGASEPIMNDSIGGLSGLCEDFHFRDLADGL
jgi:hypothetical protein